MLVKIEKTKTIWVGMTEEQAESLKETSVKLCRLEDIKAGLTGTSGMLTENDVEAINDLRQALLNV